MGSVMCCVAKVFLKSARSCFERSQMTDAKVKIHITGLYVQTACKKWDCVSACSTASIKLRERFALSSRRAWAGAGKATGHIFTSRQGHVKKIRND